MKKRIPILIIIYLLFLGESKAQTCLNSGSLQATIGNIKHEASIGEMALINTDQCHSLIVTQGYLQPDTKTKATTQSELNEATPLINVYPNPTQDFVNIEFKSIPNSSVSIHLQNSLGQVLLKKNLLTSSDFFSFQLDLTPYADGDYYVSISCENNKLLKTNSTCKIQKIKL